MPARCRSSCSGPEKAPAGDRGAGLHQHRAVPAAHGASASTSWARRWARPSAPGTATKRCAGDGHRRPVAPARWRARRLHQQGFDLQFLDSLERNPEWATQFSDHELVEKAGTQGVELLMWLAMRGALSAAGSSCDEGASQLPHPDLQHRDRFAGAGQRSFLP
jgi:hypothetical protein